MNKWTLVETTPLCRLKTKIFQIHCNNLGSLYPFLSQVGYQFSIQTFYVYRMVCCVLPLQYLNLPKHQKAFAIS